MEREEIVRDLHGQIESLARLHILHGLHHSAGFAQHRERIMQTVSRHSIDTRRELDPMVLLLYRRYCD